VLRGSFNVQNLNDRAGSISARIGISDRFWWMEDERTSGTPELDAGSLCNGL
jgi:hypothetical protein